MGSGGIEIRDEPPVATSRQAGRCKRTSPAFSGSPEGRLLGFRGCASCRVRRSCPELRQIFLSRFLSCCDSSYRPPANGLSKSKGNTGCPSSVCLEKCQQARLLVVQNRSDKNLGLQIRLDADRLVLVVLCDLLRHEMQTIQERPCKDPHQRISWEREATL
ncbi:hypothetical protein PAHAL_4G104500 [Panicum hallii]|uniref:Uncharacterized protein n=1 Tax=Panicum hallii TaxID=206008 RepID=A0A2T8JCH9_9POAL|nr:hypothetical protein PAHAL_4G104500 [Panicum hallii]